MSRVVQSQIGSCPSLFHSSHVFGAPFAARAEAGIAPPRGPNRWLLPREGKRRPGRKDGLGSPLPPHARWHTTVAHDMRASFRSRWIVLPIALATTSCKRPVPPPPPPVAPSAKAAHPRAVLQLAAGWEHTCALLAGGGVRCWGANRRGELGYGDNEPRGDKAPPATGGDVDVGGPARQIAAGRSHTCALLESGRVRCWGANHSGQLGTPITRSADLEPPAPITEVNVGGEVTQLAAGDAHTCALLRGGRVRCWGANAHGQLGHGTDDSVRAGVPPSESGDVRIGGPVSQIVAGGRHTCAVLDQGRVRCWGEGFGDIGVRRLPETAPDVALGGPVSQLVAGESHTCALLKDGRVRCFGATFWGALGVPHVEGAPGPVGAPVEVRVGSPARQIAAGGEAACSLVGEGTARCWGHGAHRYRFSGRADAPAPHEAVDFDVGGTVTQLVMGSLHACALLQTGAVRCWGNGYEGQLGYGSREGVYDAAALRAAGDVRVE